MTPCYIVLSAIFSESPIVSIFKVNWDLVSMFKALDKRAVQILKFWLVDLEKYISVLPWKEYFSYGPAVSL
jgi:hypothetical protein